MMEFLQSIPARCSSPISTIRRYGGINPYALGFGMMQDIKRICDNPTEEDREWLPEIAGSRRLGERAEGRLGQLPRRELRPPVS